jgi:lipopolysaccharide transport system ATP-binding protein
MTIAIHTEKLGKLYRLGGPKPGRLLYEELSRRLGAGARTDRETPSGTLWALKDVSFEVRVGEIVGVVGRNGAGKSTLLKILARITEPTQGWASLRGRLASLLEVGTGFHPELTGRENVFLNGAILGLRRREIASRFDEIVSFAEVDRFLDTPVKHYSSGMFMRLAFAVAAHLDPDVLLVDEVLAVGDAAFQRKCLGRMESIAGSGRTVLFVSHNLGAVRSLCSSMLLLEAGGVAYAGGVEEGLARYESGFTVGGGELPADAFAGPLAETVRFDRLEIRQEGMPVGMLDPTLPFEIRVEGATDSDFASFDVTLSLFRDGFRLFSCHDAPRGEPLATGRFESRFELPARLLRSGSYTVGVGGQRPGMGGWVWAPEVARLEIAERSDEGFDPRDVGAVNVPYRATRSVIGEAR